MFVCVAVYLNWHYGKEAAQDVSGAALSDEASSDAERVASAPAPQVLSAEDDKESSGGDETASVELSAVEASDGYFAQARLSREQARDASVELLRETAASEDASQDVKDAAFESLSRIAENTLAESQIEGLVMAKGFADCVTYISDDSISVVVGASPEGLDSGRVTQIKDIVISETGVSAAAIKIVEVSG